MKIIRKDGRGFEFDIASYGRGRWASSLIRVDGECQYVQGDPIYSTEREARHATRQTIDKWHIVPRYGWCQ